MTSKVETVLGPVPISALGRTLTHEHLAMTFTHFYREPPKQIVDVFENPFCLEKSGFLRQFPYSSKGNLVLNDHAAKEAVVNDVIAYKKFGGGTIVENSTVGLDRDVNFYKLVSEKSDVNIVAGTGFYVENVQAKANLSKTTEQMYDHMLTELTTGFLEEPSVKAGFMGEIASVWPLREFERRAIVAAGELQPQVGCGVSFHPHRAIEAPFEIIRLYLEAGGSKDKVVMSHLDRTLLENDKLLEFSELGTYCQFDLFGVEVSFYQLNPAADMPSDGQRIDKIKLLIDDGKSDKVLMSHDIHTKHRLTAFGGHGYAHIINTVLPKMALKGISQDTIDRITIDNPAKWLATNI